MTHLKARRYDLIIIGAGVTGLSTAFHLWERGYRNILLISSAKQRSTTADIPGFVAPGLPDNFTRLAHQYGVSAARSIWQAGDRAFQGLKKHCLSQGVPAQYSERLRLASSSAESQEVKQAISLMTQLGLSSRERRDITCRIGDHIEQIQEEGLGGACVDVDALCQSLLPPGLARCEDHILSVQPNPEHIQIHGGSESYQSEMLVLACHLGISDLLPLPEESLVPYVDQWHEFGVSWNGPPLPAGTVFSVQHGYLWGVVRSPQSILFGGARFLRPMAGIGETKPVNMQKLTKHLKFELERCFPDLRVITENSGTTLVEIRPCDEIPVIGPMFGESRILFATGYMGYGLSWGFWAGKQLSALVDQGQATDLPRSLWPERFRSLEA